MDTVDFAARVEARDVRLFDAIASESSRQDRESLLLIQSTVRASGPYVYLEIGSHLGGSVQPHYGDSLCTRINSIDPRPAIQPDERGRSYEYSDNSSARMLANLHSAFPSIDAHKVQVFDCDVRAIDPSAIDERPRLCFIDGEHTNAAVLRDFNFCLEVCEIDAVIAFHDAGIVFRGIREIKRELAARSIQFEGLMLGGCVYAILLRGAIETYGPRLRPFRRNEAIYFSQASVSLQKSRLFHRWPALGKLASGVKRTTLKLAGRSP
jgi:Methyltransferase domain